MTCKMFTFFPLQFAIKKMFGFLSWANILSHTNSLCDIIVISILVQNNRKSKTIDMLQGQGDWPPERECVSERKREMNPRRRIRHRATDFRSPLQFGLKGPNPMLSMQGINFSSSITPPLVLPTMIFFYFMFFQSFHFPVSESKSRRVTRMVESLGIIPPEPQLGEKQGVHLQGCHTEEGPNVLCEVFVDGTGTSGQTV